MPLPLHSAAEVLVCASTLLDCCFHQIHTAAAGEVQTLCWAVDRADAEAVRPPCPICTAQVRLWDVSWADVIGLHCSTFLLCWVCT